MISAEAFKFYFVSGVGWCVDFTIYYLLTVNGSSPFSSNFVSANVAAFLVFFVSYFYLYGGYGLVSFLKRSSAYIFYTVSVVLIFSFVIDVLSSILSNTKFISLVSEPDSVPAISKIIITPINLVCNYLASSWISRHG